MLKNCIIGTDTGQAFLGEQIFNYCADDLNLLICKTNARRHVRREKNATMLRGGGGGGGGKEQTLISELIQGQFFYIRP